MANMTVVRTRIDADLKKSFDAVAKSNDLTSSQVLRYFIRDYVKKNAQKDLFTKRSTAVA